MSIRKENPADMDSIWQLNAEAFESDAEANLVNALRDSGIHTISLVYEQNGVIYGHILFTPVTLNQDSSNLKLIGLAPMAVVPEKQNQGIGSLLVKAGIKQCIVENYDAVVVLGHPSYYPRFGFQPSVNFLIKSAYDVADDVFMVLELEPGILKGHSGTIHYHALFDQF